MLDISKNTGGAKSSIVSGSAIPAEQSVRWILCSLDSLTQGQMERMTLSSDMTTSENFDVAA